jgi:hypothetical protein
MAEAVDLYDEAAAGAVVVAFGAFQRFTGMGYSAMLIRWEIELVTGEQELFLGKRFAQSQNAAFDGLFKDKSNSGGDLFCRQVVHQRLQRLAGEQAVHQFDF